MQASRQSGVSGRRQREEKGEGGTYFDRPWRMFGGGRSQSLSFESPLQIVGGLVGLRALHMRDPHNLHARGHAMQIAQRQYERALRRLSEENTTLAAMAMQGQPALRGADE